MVRNYAGKIECEENKLTIALRVMKVFARLTERVVGLVECLNLFFAVSCGRAIDTGACI